MKIAQGIDSAGGCPLATSVSEASAQPASLSRAQWNPAPPDMPVPGRLNLMLVLVTFSLAVGLLWLASWVETWYWALAVAAVFSYVLLTNYALLHEATHGNLHPNTRVNYCLGLVTGALFPIP